jgi:acyl carrier protein
MPHLDRVRTLIADVFQIPVEDVRPETSPDTVEAWDSIQHLNIVLALEQEFQIQLSPEEIEQLLSVELIADLMAEKAPASKVA